MLDPTELRLYKSESDVVRFAQGEGFLQVSATTRCCSSTRSSRSTSSTRATSRSGCSRAESELEKAEEGSEERRAAERDKRRYEAFLELAKGS